MRAHNNYRPSLSFAYHWDMNAQRWADLGVSKYDLFYQALALHCYVLIAVTFCFCQMLQYMQPLMSVYPLGSYLDKSGR